MNDIRGEHTGAERTNEKTYQQLARELLLVGPMRPTRTSSCAISTY